MVYWFLFLKVYHHSEVREQQPPLPDRIQTLPDIEDGATLCTRATVQSPAATSRGLREPFAADEEGRTNADGSPRRRTMRRTRQRLRNYCTML